jgi:hypothetical protein
MRSVRVHGDKHYRPQSAWVSVATGCLPEHHGVTAFYHTARDIRRPTLWDVVQSSGRSSGLFAWPITWPPKPLNGFIIPCYHARDEATWPAALAPLRRIDRQRHEAQHGRETRLVPRLSELGDLLRTLRHNGVGLRVLPALTACTARSLLSRSPEGRALGVRHGKAEIMVELFLHLYRTWQPHLGTFHSSIVDNVSHRYWRYREPAAFGLTPGAVNGRLARAVDEAYVRTDRALGKVLAATSPNTVIAVVSEHGMAPEYDTPEVGEWQYLIRGAPLAALVGLEGLVNISPIARWIAYRPIAGQLSADDAASRLRRVTVVETGLPLFNVHRYGPDEVIVKFCLRKDVPEYRAGHLDRLHVAYREHQRPFEAIARRVGPRRSAMHDDRGLVVFCGPGVRRGARLADSLITDFAPTLLAAVGLQAASPMDGHVLDVFG